MANANPKRQALPKNCRFNKVHQRNFRQCCSEGIGDGMLSIFPGGDTPYMTGDWTWPVNRDTAAPSIGFLPYPKATTGIVSPFQLQID